MEKMLKIVYKKITDFDQFFDFPPKIENIKILIKIWDFFDRIFFGKHYVSLSPRRVVPRHVP